MPEPEPEPEPEYGCCHEHKVFSDGRVEDYCFGGYTPWVEQQVRHGELPEELRLPVRPLRRPAVTLLL